MSEIKKKRRWKLEWKANLKPLKWKHFLFYLFIKWKFAIANQFFVFYFTVSTASKACGQGIWTASAFLKGFFFLSWMPFTWMKLINRTHSPLDFEIIVFNKKVNNFSIYALGNSFLWISCERLYIILQADDSRLFF